ncbi:hypothetical protein ACTU6V_05385 [Microbacterium sp. A204]|uniref:hypothetical protein n=1 Tax=Microbacterium sp. A204 TaxID=3457321 RepID=UPI003FCF3B3E
MSSDRALRAWFSSQIKPLLPAGWRYIPNQDTPAQITVVTVVYKLLEIEPLAEAPIGSNRNTIVLTVLSPHEDDVKAEDALDNDVIDMVTALDGHAKIAWSRAQKVRDPKTDRLAWDITVSVITTRSTRS